MPVGALSGEKDTEEWRERTLWLPSEYHKVPFGDHARSIGATGISGTECSSVPSGAKLITPSPRVVYNRPSNPFRNARNAPDGGRPVTTEVPSARRVIVVSVPV